MAQSDLTDLLGEHALAYGIPGAALGVLQDGARTIATYGIEDVRTGVPTWWSSRWPETGRSAGP